MGIYYENVGSGGPIVRAIAADGSQSRLALKRVSRYPFAARGQDERTREWMRRSCRRTFGSYERAADDRPASRPGRTLEDCDQVRHRCREPAAGRPRGRADSRARRQRRRCRDCRQRGDGARRASEQRSRRRPLRDLLRGQDPQAVRPECGRVGSERAHARVPPVQEIHADAEYGHLLRHRSWCGQGLGDVPRPVRCPATLRPSRARDLLRRGRIPRHGCHLPCMAGSFGQAFRRAPRGGSLSAERPSAACGRDLQESCTGGDVATDRAKKAPQDSTKARRPTRFSPWSASLAGR